MQLAHKVKDTNGRAYNRTAFLKDRKEMMQRWGRPFRRASTCSAGPFKGHPDSLTTNLLMGVGYLGSFAPRIVGC